MEASIEHLSRGTVRHVDVLLAVAEPYYRALETLGRTVPLARELAIPHIYAVANKLRSDRDAEMIRNYAARLGVDLIGMIPYDEAAQEADRRNRALVDHDPNSSAVRAISEIADALRAVERGKVAAVS